MHKIKIYRSYVNNIQLTQKFTHILRAQKTYNSMIDIMFIILSKVVASITTNFVTKFCPFFI